MGIMYDSIREIDLKTDYPMFPEVYVSERDEIVCLSHILRPDLSEDSPWRISVTRRGLPKGAGRFIRLEHGCFGFYDDVANEPRSIAYKRIPVSVRFPSGAQTYYDAHVYGEETTGYDADDEITRAIFGLTYDEVRELLEGYAKVFGICNGYAQYPRLTRSNKNAHSCDLTGNWIPESFPYITFAQAGYEFSTVSLWGFYRHIRMMDSACRRDGTMTAALINAGVSEEVMKQVMESGRDPFQAREKVTRQALYPGLCA